MKQTFILYFERKDSPCTGEVVFGMFLNAVVEVSTCDLFTLHQSRVSLFQAPKPPSPQAPKPRNSGWMISYPDLSPEK